jgi:hypothetical protein
MLPYQAIATLTLPWALLATAKPIHSSKIKWVECSKNVPNVPGALDLTGFDLANLPSTLQCGQIEVPMDYAKPFGASNKITLGLAMHRPTKPKGVIFLYAPSGFKVNKHNTDFYPAVIRAGQMPPRWSPGRWL